MNNHEMFERYERVRLSGKYNMITECGAAAREAGLTMEQYKQVIASYSDLKAAYEAHQIIEKALEEPAPF